MQSRKNCISRDVNWSRRPRVGCTLATVFNRSGCSLLLTESVALFNGVQVSTQRACWTFPWIVKSKSIISQEITGKDLQVEP